MAVETVVPFGRNLIVLARVHVQCGAWFLDLDIDVPVLVGLVAGADAGGETARKAEVGRHRANHDASMETFLGTLAVIRM